MQQTSKSWKTFLQEMTRCRLSNHQFQDWTTCGRRERFKKCSRRSPCRCPRTGYRRDVCPAGRFGCKCSHLLDEIHVEQAALYGNIGRRGSGCSRDAEAARAGGRLPANHARDNQRSSGCSGSAFARATAGDSAIVFDNMIFGHTDERQTIIVIDHVRSGCEKLSRSRAPGYDWMAHRAAYSITTVYRPSLYRFLSLGWIHCQSDRRSLPGISGKRSRGQRV